MLGGTPRGALSRGLPRQRSLKHFPARRRLIVGQLGHQRQASSVARFSMMSSSSSSSATASHDVFGYTGIDVASILTNDTLAEIDATDTLQLHPYSPGSRLGYGGLYSKQLEDHARRKEEASSRQQEEAARPRAAAPSSAARQQEEAARPPPPQVDAAADAADLDYAKAQENLAGILDSSFVDASVDDDSDYIKRLMMKKELPSLVVPEPVRSPAEEALRERQVQLEAFTIDEAVANYRELMESLVKIGNASSLPPVSKLMSLWLKPLCERIEMEKAATLAGVVGADRGIYGPPLLLCPTESLAVIVMHTVMGLTVKTPTGVKLGKLCVEIGESVQTEARLMAIRRQHGPKGIKRVVSGGKITHQEGAEPTENQWKSKLKALSDVDVKQLIRLSPHLRKYRAKRAIEGCDGHEVLDWSAALCVKLGAALVEQLVIVALDPTTGEPCFKKTTAFAKVKTTTMLEASWGLLNRASSTQVVEKFLQPRYLPMLVEPQPWNGPEDGGFLVLQAKAMRTHGDRQQTDALHENKPVLLYKGLHCLGKVPWRINRAVYDVIKKGWDERIPNMPEFPAFEDHLLPPDIYKPKKKHSRTKQTFFGDDEGEKEGEKVYEDLGLSPEEYAKGRQRRDRLIQRNAELHGLRCDLKIKLAVAERFVDEDRFYFPYNVDFRGRAYPVPPNLNHLGSDVCRGMLLFAEAKPLGENGWRWLQIHMANLYGHSKLSLDDRVAFAEANMEEILKVAEAPFESTWWRKADDPWQCLATCLEMSNALKHPDGVSAFESALPVHADGSCNGLQHYAALSRDLDGGEQVNLTPGPKPRDVYARVCALVLERIAADKAKAPNFDAAEYKQRRASSKNPNGKEANKVEFFDKKMNSKRKQQLEKRIKTAEKKKAKKADAEEEEKQQIEDHLRELYSLKEEKYPAIDEETRLRDKAAAVEDEATTGLLHERRKMDMANIVDGMVSRKVVKQTVMTSVYGVTFIGAREQVKGRLKDVVSAALNPLGDDSEEERLEKLAWFKSLGVINEEGEVDDDELFHMSCYVARLTLDSIGELFSSAKGIMDWLASCAQLVAREGDPMSWTTPLGLPVIQPYRRDATLLVKTCAQQISLKKTSDDVPVSIAKQRSAFPPNFVHSLDSTHMLLTALQMDSENLTFTAVHDSYWTHADDLPRMNVVLREAFVELYSKPILQDLRGTLEKQYGPKVDFPPIPPPGDLQIKDVLDAKYFFS